MASAKITNDALTIPTFDVSNWQEEKTGFAPYWKPTKGASFIGRVVAMEEARDADDFTRFLIQAGQDMKCQRGAADDAEEVDVKKGEFFTISVYFSLLDLFQLYLESGIKPWMHIMANEEVKTKTPGRKVWNWTVKVSPEDKKKVDAVRLEAGIKQPKELQTQSS